MVIIHQKRLPLAYCFLTAMVLLFGYSVPGNATHLVGGDLTYQRLSPNTYEVTLNYYFDCDGSRGAFKEEPDYTVSSDNCNQSRNLALDTIDKTGNNIAPLCNKFTSSCNGGSKKGIERWIFKDTVTLNQQCSDWTISWHQSKRTGSITTINDPGNDDLYLETSLDNKNYPDNNSPYFTNDPLAFACKNQTFTYNHGAKDPEGDSLVYSFYKPKTSESSSVDYQSGFSYNQPVKSNENVTIDKSSGNITMKPTQKDITVLGVKVEEYDTAGNLKGIILRDIQIIVQSCNSPNPPKLAGFTDSNEGYKPQNNTFDTTVCPGRPLDLYIAGKDQDPNDSLFMNWNQGILDANFEVIGDSTRTPVGHLKWIAKNPSSGFKTQRYSFTVSVRDDNCSYFTQVANGYSIDVIPSKKVKLGDTAYVACDDSLLLKPNIKGSNAKAQIDWSTGQRQDSIWVQEPGKYWVTVSDKEECAISDTIIVLPSLIPDYDITPSFSADRGCINDTLQFYDSSTSQQSTVNSWYWEFGDGDTASIQNPKHKYQDTGSYEVKLIITDGNDCQDTLYKQIGIDSKPDASFVADPSCSRNPKHLKDQSQVFKGEVKQNFWEFGDGEKDTTLSPDHIYQEGGNYQVQQIAETGGGCRDTNRKIIQVKPTPKPGFVVKNPCKGQTGTFKDTSSIQSPGTIASYNWSFADTSSSNKQNPQQHFNKQQKFPTQLLVESDQGCQDSIEKSIIIYQPVANVQINSDSLFCKGDSVEVNTSINSNSIDIFRDDFNKNQLSQWNKVTNGDINNTCGAKSGKALYFSGSNDREVVTNNFNVINGATISFYLKYGIGSEDSCDDPEPGEEVVLEYSTNDGNSWTSLDTLDINQYQTFTQFSQTIPADAKTAATSFRVRQKDFTDCGVTQCFDHWVMDNFAVFATPDFSFNWTPKSGVSAPRQKEPWLSPDSQTTYHLQLKEQRKNCYSRDSLSLKDPLWVEPGFKTSAPVCKNSPVQFNDTSIVQNGKLTNTQWSLGDGTTSGQNKFEHSYSSSGDFPITLTKTLEGGCQEQKTKTLTILGQSKADFSFNTVCEGEPTRFTNETKTPDSADIKQFQWYFGDVDSSSDKDPSYEFASSGNYEVDLIVYAENGCSDSFTDNVTVKASPNAQFTINDTLQCSAENFFIFDNKTGGASKISYKWSFGDGDTALIANTNYSYDSFGKYRIQLLAEADNQCRDSLQKTIQVASMPNADFSNLRVCLGDTLVINNQASIPKGKIQGWQYQFGDGFIANAANPAHYYQNEGRYDVQETVTSQFGCEDTIKKEVIVYGDPGVSNIKNVTVKNDQNIKVIWESIPKVNPGRFLLERATGLNNFQKVGLFEETQQTYLDTAVRVDDTFYTYRVQIIDSCGNIGDFSEQQGTSIKLAVAEGEGEPKLKWTPYWGWSVKDYQVNKATDGTNTFEAIEALSTLSNTTLSVIDKFSSNTYGQRCYQVVAHKKGNPKTTSVSNTACLERSMRLHVPNAFSPNKDGHNDFFQPKGTYVVDYQIRIYNRWGEKLFESHSLEKPWDGTYKGEQVPAGTYIYSIFAKGANGDIKEFNGSLHLIK